MSSVRIGRINRTGALLGVATVVLGGAAAVASAAAGPDGESYAAPSAGARWDYQIGGVAEYNPAPAVVSRDNAEQPWRGLYNICYVNAFQSQPGDQSLKDYWLRIGGAAVEDPNWEGEYVLDTRGHRADLVSAFKTVLSSCASKGFDAVEFDNLDSYERSKGGLTSADNIAYVRDLIEVAHGLGLAAAQKNASDLVGRAPFDFAVTESCLRWNECGSYTRAYQVVLDVEYPRSEDSEGGLTLSDFQAKCADAARSGSSPSFVYRDLQVTAGGTRKWCDAQPAVGQSSGGSKVTITSGSRTSTSASGTPATSTTSRTRTATPTATSTPSSTRTATRTTATRTTAGRTTATRTTPGRPTWRPGRGPWPMPTWTHRAQAS